MNVYIVGKGAVGTYLGDLLRGIGVDVAYAPRALGDVSPYDADVAIVATKAYDTGGAIETLRKAIRFPEKCVFVSPQNGVGNEERLAAAFGAENVVAAALTTPVDRDRDGNARPAKEGGLALAPVGSNAYNWLSATFAGTGLAVKVVEDWRALKWSKLALNVVANASCAILNVLPNRFVHFEKIFTLEIRMIREVRAVMQALHVEPIDLPRYPVRALFRVAALPSALSRTLLAHSIAGARGTKPPSLLLDLRRANPQTEVAVLNGAVAAAGLELRVPTPVNAVYARVLNDIAHTPPLWAKYREHPDRLEAEVIAEVKRARALSRK
ncbi:MAG TPA: ketopantoate reductase C-terminal domain-containing protein [Candidatus Binatia bacterium]|nr:ketopantoate reductase C-terminal domain-containing protein [Candidatus Binatia bacterium]